MKKILVITGILIGTNFLFIVGYLPPGLYKERNAAAGLEGCRNCSFDKNNQTLKCDCFGVTGTSQSYSGAEDEYGYISQQKSYCFMYRSLGREAGKGILDCDLSWIKETPQATIDHLLKNFTKEDLTNQRTSLLYQALLRPKYKEMLALLAQNGLGLKKEDTNLLEDALVQAARQKNKEVIEFLLSQGAKGATALLSAQHEKNTEMVQFLQQKGIKMPVLPGSKGFGR